MIDEKRLIERIKWSLIAIKGQGIDVNHTEVIEKDKLLKIINEQPKVGEWIPCRDRSPNCNGVYQITRKIAEGEYNFYISDSAYFDGQNTWHSDNRVNHGRPYLSDIVAWQPLSEPYKGE